MCQGFILFLKFFASFCVLSKLHVVTSSIGVNGGRINVFLIPSFIAVIDAEWPCRATLMGHSERDEIVSPYHARSRDVLAMEIAADVSGSLIVIRDTELEDDMKLFPRSIHPNGAADKSLI